MFGLSAVLAILQLIGMAWMPRSPKWLFSKGRCAEAKAVLIKIRSSPVISSACCFLCRRVIRNRHVAVVEVSLHRGLALDGRRECRGSDMSYCTEKASQDTCSERRSIRRSLVHVQNVHEGPRVVQVFSS